MTTKKTRKYKRKRSSTKRSSTKRKRSSAKSKRSRIKQKGGDILNAIRLGGAILEHFEPIKITYGKTVIQPNANLTGKASLYNTKPIITYNPNKEKTYLITLTDPDAPNGVSAKQPWTHYVVLMNDNNIIEELYPYKPPTPPPNSGVHRYIFNAYAYKYYDSESEEYKKLKNKNLQAGNVYYKQILEPIIKNKDVTASFQFTVQTN